MLRKSWTKILLFTLSLLPLCWLAWRYWHNDLTANPIEYITHFTGDWTIRFLVLTLAITPLRKTLKPVEIQALWYNALRTMEIWRNASIRMPIERTTNNWLTRRAAVFASSSGTNPPDVCATSSAGIAATAPYGPTRSSQSASSTACCLVKKRIRPANPHGTITA